ncbi:hypothetical protein ACFRKB_36270 [Streptomyces scopuliridis]|uniref:hypothetical protein n=1 Tax=Streptomyces scopuliridis TaxID=452529 RepID=UPI0036877AB2
MRAHHAHTAKALDVQVEPGSEFWGWAGRTLGAPARTTTGAPVWLRLVSAPQDKASGKLWDGALDAQHAFGDLDGHRPALLAVHDVVDDGTAYRAELSVRIDEPVLSDDPILQHELPLQDPWWNDLAGTPLAADDMSIFCDLLVLCCLTVMSLKISLNSMPFPRRNDESAPEPPSTRTTCELRSRTDEFPAPRRSVRVRPTHGRLAPCGN